jgi:RND superfamily putative drug exporter
VKTFARLVLAKPLVSLLIFVALIAGAGVWGLQAFSSLQSGGYSDPDSESAKVFETLQENYGNDPVDLAVIADFPQDVDTAASAESATQLTDELAAIPGVREVSSYFSLGGPATLKSTDGTAAYFLIKFDDSVSGSKQTSLIEDTAGPSFGDVKLHYTGIQAMANALNEGISRDIALSESIAIPLCIILLLFVFGSVVSAGLPLLIGGAAVLGGFFFVWLATRFTDVSIFSANLIIALGLGLGIDYALLMVNRFREERTRGLAVKDAATKTMETAGRTVFFSGLTVAVVLASMVIFPQYFLRSFAYAGVGVVAVAVFGALVALPAMLALLGDRVNKLRVLRRNLAPKDTGGWSVVSRWVMRWAVPVFVVTAVGMGALMSLGAGVKFGLVDERILPASHPVAISSEIVRERFDGQESKPVEIILTGASEQEAADYAAALSRLDNITRVQSAAGVTVDGQTDPRAASAFADYVLGDQQRIVAVHDVEARSNDGITVTQDIRALETPFTVQVGGIAADYTDSLDAITDKLPWLVLWVFATTLILLFLFTGSILLPLKAFVFNIMSLGATLGFLTWVFVGGHLKWLIGDFTTTGSIDASNIILIAVVTFGLSMDYELFLLSRIKEQHDAGMNTEDSVAIGLQRSGPIITAAALILAANFLPLAISGISSIKMLALGISFAIILDATVVRALLVPSLMKLFGNANWWAPGWMRRIYNKFGLAH